MEIINFHGWMEGCRRLECAPKCSRTHGRRRKKNNISNVSLFADSTVSEYLCSVLSSGWKMFICALFIEYAMHSLLRWLSLWTGGMHTLHHMEAKQCIKRCHFYFVLSVYFFAPASCMWKLMHTESCVRESCGWVWIFIRMGCSLLCVFIVAGVCVPQQQ